MGFLTQNMFSFRENAPHCPYFLVLLQTSKDHSGMLGVPQSGSHQTNCLSDEGARERGGGSLAELEKQPQIFPLGNPDNSSSCLLSTEISPHVARHGSSISIFRLRCCGRPRCLLCRWLVFGEDIVSTEVPGALRLSHCVSKPRQYEITGLFL